MIIKLYWITRVLAYIACLAGILMYLMHQADADPRTVQYGLGLVGLGFVSFFISYALRAWLRFGPGSRTESSRNP